MKEMTCIRGTCLQAAAPQSNYCNRHKPMAWQVHRQPREEKRRARRLDLLWGGGSLLILGLLLSMVFLQGCGHRVISRRYITRDTGPLSLTVLAIPAMLLAPGRVTLTVRTEGALPDEGVIYVVAWGDGCTSIWEDSLNSTGRVWQKGHDYHGSGQMQPTVVMWDIGGQRILQKADTYLEIGVGQ